MKNPDKVVIGILDQGVFPWWDNDSSELAQAYHSYYDNFEMDFKDFTADRGTAREKKVSGSHGYWVLDRLLQVCGNTDKVKIVNCKIFRSNGKSNMEDINNALSYLTSEGVDLVNMSIGIPRHARTERSHISDLNRQLDRVVDEAKGLSIISAGNEGEILSNGEVIENTNIFASDADNNLSVGSHDRSGSWDKFSSAGGHVDVSTVGSNLKLLGERKFATVSGTSFSAPTFTGVCANYVIDQFSATRNGEKTVKDVVYEHLDEAIKPTYKTKGFWKRMKNNFKKGEQEYRSPWYGRGSFEAYARYFIKEYGRDVERCNLFKEEGLRVM